MHGAEFRSYEDFGAYHAAQMATQKQEEPNHLREFAIAFIGGAIFAWVVLSGGGLF